MPVNDGAAGLGEGDVGFDSSRAARRSAEEFNLDSPNQYISISN